MIITKMAIPRRTVLRGLGTALALPLLDSMVPAFAASNDTTAQPARRLGVVYVPNGMAMQYWTPAVEGSEFEFTRILQPLMPFREDLVILSGTNNIRGYGNHAAASSKFLTGWMPERNSGAELKAAESMDQVAAAELGKHTQLASLELALDAGDFAGACAEGLCAYQNTIAWRNETTPLPMESNPRVVFERLFGDADSTERSARLMRIRRRRSLLDAVTETVGDLNRTIGPGDRSKLTQYLDAVRDVERRIQAAEEQSDRDLPTVEQPSGIPLTFEDHAKMMFDLQVLAYQSDLTRVITMMMGRELSGRTFPEIGVPDAHHPLSHHEDDPEKIDRLSKVNVYQMQMFAYYLEKLRTTPDGEGSLLDHTLLLYGAGMSNSNVHSRESLPLLLAGGAGDLKRGRHVVCSGDTPVANLLLTILDKTGVPLDRFGESTGKLQMLSI